MGLVIPPEVVPFLILAAIVAAGYGMVYMIRAEQRRTKEIVDRIKARGHYEVTIEFGKPQVETRWVPGKQKQEKQ